jgi:hypothetical protein
MKNVAVRQNGVDLGTVQFRGLSPADGTEPKERRRYKCNPKACVPKDIARKIADRIAAGVTAGYEKDFEWRT